MRITSTGDYLILEKENKKFITKSGLIFTGGNAAGKTELLHKLEGELSNSKYLKVNGLKKIYDELSQATLETNSIFQEFVLTNKELILNEINIFFNIEDDIQLDEDLITFRYSNGNEITSNGQLNIFYLLFISLFFIMKKEKYILLLDEPNSNLDDLYANLVLPSIYHLSKKFFKRPYIVASTNNINLIEEIEDFIILNVKTNELAYSNDLLGLPKALKRIVSSYKTQEYFYNKVKNILSELYLERKFCQLQGDYLIYKDESELKVLDTKLFSKGEEIIFKLLKENFTSYSTITYKINFETMTAHE